MSIVLYSRTFSTILLAFTLKVDIYTHSATIFSKSSFSTSLSHSLNPWTSTTESVTTSSWLLNSGASHHVATDLVNLSLHSEYDGTDAIAVGNDNKLNITHTSMTNLHTPSHSFLLKDVLCVPNMTRNLLSVSKFCQSNNASIEFLPNCFFVKYLRTCLVLLKGPLNDNTYEWPTNASSSSSSLLCSPVFVHPFKISIKGLDIHMLKYSVK